MNDIDMKIDKLSKASELTVCGDKSGKLVDGGSFSSSSQASETARSLARSAGGAYD